LAGQNRRLPKPSNQQTCKGPNEGHNFQLRGTHTLTYTQVHLGVVAPQHSTGRSHERAQGSHACHAIAPRPVLASQARKWWLHPPHHSQVSTRPSIEPFVPSQFLTAAGGDVCSPATWHGQLADDSGSLAASAPRLPCRGRLPCLCMKGMHACLRSGAFPSMRSAQQALCKSQSLAS
jgi:hypothetical protein